MSPFQNSGTGRRSGFQVVYSQFFTNGFENQTGQIIGTSRDQKPQMVVKSKGNPRNFQGNPGWVKYKFHLAQILYMEEFGIWKAAVDC